MIALPRKRMKRIAELEPPHGAGRLAARCRQPPMSAAAAAAAVAMIDTPRDTTEDAA